MSSDFEAMAKRLEETGDYKVLRRLSDDLAGGPVPDGVATRNGLFIDFETTGLDPERDEIIEIAMVPFTYGTDGMLYKSLPAFQSFQEPANPIPEEITRLTGITDEMVAGTRIDLGAVEEMLAPIHFVIAHNASFDRRFAEKLTQTFSVKAWGCSMSQIPWQEEGIEGTKLGYIANSMGYFFDAHRATDDCLAALSFLNMPLPKSGSLALAVLLETARETSIRVWAEHAPFDLKDELKRRGYRWNDGSDGRPKSWYCEVPESDLDAELQYLRHEIYRYEPDFRLDRVTAYERFSGR